MRFGNSKTIKYSINQQKIKEKIFLGIRNFAYLPTELEDGTWLCLEHYYTYYYGSCDNDNGSFSIYSINSKYKRKYANKSIDHIICDGITIYEKQIIHNEAKIFLKEINYEL